MKNTKEIKEIKLIADTSGQLLFSMGFNHLFSVGQQCASGDNFLAKSREKIEKTTDEDSFMTVDFEMEICVIANKLSKFSFFDLMMFVQKYKPYSV